MIISLAPGENVLCIFDHSAYGPPPGKRDAQLAMRFAPVFQLAGAEPFHPIAIEDYVHSAVLALCIGNKRPIVVASKPRVFYLEGLLVSSPSCLDLPFGEPFAGPGPYRRREHEIENQHPRPVVYWHLARDERRHRVAIQYWLLYLFNDLARGNRHEADWEHVTILLKRRKVAGIFLSAHGKGGWEPLGPASGAPLVYVAKGSHANYAKPGRPGVHVCGGCQHVVHETVNGKGRTFSRNGYSLIHLGGPSIQTDWGSGNWIALKKLKDRVTDPRSRDAYSDPFSEIQAAGGG